MQSKALTPDQYVAELPADRRGPFTALRDAIRKNLPAGFEEIMGCGMINWVVPHSLYPPGYHVDPTQPLPFLAIASQMHYIAVYHMGIYASPDLLKWFKTEYPKHTRARLDMGKCCIRFKKVDEMPIDLIAQLSSRASVAEWIEIWERHNQAAAKRRKTRLPKKPKSAGSGSARKAGPSRAARG